MIFTVYSSTIYSSLVAISRVIAPKPVFPILSNFLFNIESGKLVVTAADNDTTLEAIVEITDSDKDGQIALPAKTLLDALKEIPDQPLTFNINESSYETTITYMNGEYCLVGNNADEYPTPAVLQESVSFELQSDLLLDGLSKSLFATAEDELRPVMNGILCEVSSEGATFVASDGHKLVCYKNTQAQISERASFILPKKPASLIKSLLSKESNQVTIEFDSRVVRFNLTDFRMVCRHIDGRYPNYNSVIPKNNPHSLTIDRLTMLNALRRISIFSPASTGLLKIRIQQDQLTAYAQDNDFSTSAKETLPCQYDGPAMSIGFKSSFLIDIFSNIQSQEITFKVADPARATLFVPTIQTEDTDLVMLLMPMVLND